MYRITLFATKRAQSSGQCEPLAQFNSFNTRLPDDWHESSRRGCAQSASLSRSLLRMVQTPWRKSSTHRLASSSDEQQLLYPGSAQRDAMRGRFDPSRVRRACTRELGGAVRLRRRDPLHARNRTHLRAYRADSPPAVQRRLFGVHGQAAPRLRAAACRSRRSTGSRRIPPSPGGSVS